MGPQPWLGYLTVTIHPSLRHLHTPEHYPKRRKELAKALSMWFGDLVPAGIFYPHFSGKSDPHKLHPHYNILIGGKGYDALRQKVAPMGPKWMEPLDLKAWRNFLSWHAWGIRPYDVQGYWEYRDTELTMGHALKYAVRAQGDGDPRARHHWTPDRTHLLVPFGMLAKHRRAEWLRLNPWPSEEEKASTLGWDQDPTEKCRRCGNGLRDVTPKGKV
jgi:hypothetical protein